jgi:hypothetical protein
MQTISLAHHTTETTSTKHFWWAVNLIYQTSAASSCISAWELFYGLALSPDLNILVMMANSSSTKAIGYWVFGEDTGCWFDNKQDCFPALIWDFAERRGEHVQVFVDWIRWLMILVPWVEELTINIINTCILTILGLLCSSLCSQNKNGH